MIHETLLQALEVIFGTNRESTDLTVWQVCARGLVIYVVGLAVIRAGKNRFLGRNTIFDLLLILIMASALSRSINGSAPFWETIVLAVFLVLLHAGFAMAAFHGDGIGHFIKGGPRLLVEDGEVQEDALKKTYLTENDLEEAMHLSGLPPDVSRIRIARLERDGSISMVPKAQVHEVEVAGGVQTIRIVME